MIYLKNNSETQELYIPKNGDYQGKRTYKEGFEEGIEYQKSKLSSIEIKENGLYQNEDGYNEVLVDVLCADNADIRTLWAFDNGEFTPNYNHILFDGTAYMTRAYSINRNGSFTLIFKIPSGVGNSTILSDRNGLIHIKHEDSNINIKVGDKTGSIAIERDKWHTLEIVGFDTYLLDNEPIPTQGETNLDVDNISSCYLGSFYDYENNTYTDRFQGCINFVIFNSGNTIYYLIPNQDNNFTQVSTNSGNWYKTIINPREGVFTFVEESVENVLWNKALVRYVPNLTTAAFDIEGYDFTNSFSTPEGYEGMNRVTINNRKQASKIMNDGNNINQNTIIDQNTFEITENGFYTPNMEVIPAVWFMHQYSSKGWDITDIQQERIEVRFLVTPEMIKDRSCWVFGKSDENYFLDDPQIFGLEITGNDWGAKVKYYQNGLKQEVDINYHTWIDFITYPHPDNSEVRVIECFGQYFEVENSALSTDENRITKCTIGGLGIYGNSVIKNNTAYFGMLSSIKVSTDNYNKETTISGGDGDGYYGIGFEENGISRSNKLSYYEFYKNSGFGSVNVNVPQEGGDCPELEEVTITENGTYEGAYDRVIVDVPQEGGDLNPDTLREITITENGIYTSKYSSTEGEVTGIFDDGAPFYGYGKVDGAVYNTQINLNEVGVLESLEFWYKGDGQEVADGWNEILSSNSVDSTNEGSVEFRYMYGNSINVRIGGIEEVFQLEEGAWHHFKLNKTGDDTCTLFVDDVEMYSFPLPTATSTNFYINGVAYDEYNNYSRMANGYFGLIRVNDTVIIPTENGFMNYNTNTILPTIKEGSYEYGTTTDVVVEGEPYKTINVDVNIPLQEKSEWRGDTTDRFTILPDEGYDGMSKVDVVISTPLSIKYNEGLEQGKTEGKDSVINSLQTLNVTENGTYTPPTMPFLRLDGDDKYELFHPTDNNAFEIKFRINSESDTEFFSQNGNDIGFIGLRAYQLARALSVNWYNKQINIAGVDFEKWHTLVVKMSDENARVIFDGQVYNDYNEWSSYESNGQYVEIYGNIDLEHFTFWNTWEDYNNGVTPYFNFKVTPEGLMRSYKGGEYSVVNNIGGGSAQYMVENITEGWNEVVVNIPQEEATITSSIVEDTYSKLALRTTNVRPTDNFISDKTGLVGFYGNYEEDSYISYNQDMQGVVICKHPDFSQPSVSTIEQGALNWNGIDKIHTFTISTFGESMSIDAGSNLRELHLHHHSTIMEGDINILFKIECFASCNRLSKIVFYDVYYILVEENAFDEVSNSGEVIVVGTDTSENRAKYDTLMNQLGDGWTLRFVDEYNE